MTQGEAEALIAEVLAPLTLDALRQSVAAHRPLSVKATGDTAARRALLGDDPKAAALASHARHAGRLDWHAVTATDAPPPADRIDDAEDFARLIAAFHTRGYTVRIPDVADITPRLARLVRALEMAFAVPVGGSIFWSADRARAKVHFDQNDILVLQLVGTKRWFVSSEPPLLPNSWKDVLTPPTTLGAHATVDLAPGDLLYVPRGTAHTVESQGECVHLTLTFTPLTVRAALLALLDQAAEEDKAFRATLPDPPGPLLGRALAVLAQRSTDPGFARRAFDRRVSRFTGALPSLAGGDAGASIAPVTRIRHAPLAVFHHRVVGDRIDLAIPGGHLNVHAAAGPALDFIAATATFAVSDLPDLPVEIAIGLVEKLIAAGVLEVSRAEAR